MTIQYKRNETNVSQQLSQLSQLPGGAGLNMLRADTPLEQFNQLSVGRRNLLINGDMKINQRGFTSDDTVQHTYTADRWRCRSNVTAGTFIVELDSDVPVQHELGNSIKFTCKDGVSLNNWDHESASYYFQLVQYIEPDNISHLMWGHTTGLPLTMSFWVKANHTGTYSAGMRTSHDTDGDDAPDYYYNAAMAFSIERADTWEYKTMSFHPPRNPFSTTIGIGKATLVPFISMGATNSLSHNYNDGVFRFGGQLGLESSTGGSADALLRTPGNSIQFTGVQLEAGSFATPFEYRTQSEQLFACQRYYQKQDALNLYLPEGQSYSRWVHYFNQPMRVAPTFNLFDTGGNTWSAIGMSATRHLIHAHAAPGATYPGFTADADF